MVDDEPTEYQQYEDIKEPHEEERAINLIAYDQEKGNFIMSYL
jgi:hypothetical protein